MRRYESSTTAIASDLVAHCKEALDMTVSDPARAHVLDAIGESVGALEVFVRGYECIDDPSIDTDDEILNWAFGEAPVDFFSAIWLLASGFYKASASSLRNAFDIATASLYFQVRQNTKTSLGYNRWFAEWDSGARRTPNWGEMKPLISAQPNVERFKTNHGIDMIEVVYAHFTYLCAYTHTSAYAGPDDPVTAINITGVAPVVDDTYFRRGCELTAKTVSLIAILWQVVFPQILLTEPLGPVSSGAYASLFPEPYGPLAMAVG